MIRLISPNGVQFLARDEDAPRLLANGYAKAEQKAAPKPEKAVAKKPKGKE